LLRLFKRFAVTHFARTGREPKITMTRLCSSETHKKLLDGDDPSAINSHANSRTSFLEGCFMATLTPSCLSLSPLLSIIPTHSAVFTSDPAISELSLLR